MTEKVRRDGLTVAAILARFVEHEVLPGTGIAPARFWSGLSRLIHDFGPENRALLDRRADLQAQVDAWHAERRGRPHNGVEYRAFLTEIGYLVPEGPDFEIGTTGVDPEIARVPGPQLVVPVMNARYALNAANARWGSLYDALYGTDALGDLPAPGGFDPSRGRRVVDWAKAHLDRATPLDGARWGEVTAIDVVRGRFVARTSRGEHRLADPVQFAGWREGAPRDFLLRAHGLHLIVRVDPNTAVGRDDPAGIADVILESALTAIMDFEDSIAAVDAEDKVAAYRNWLGLMRGDLSEVVTKGGRSFARRLNPDLVFHAPDGDDIVLRGTALMLCRNVGHLMTTPAVHDRDGREAGEGLVDAMVTVATALHDLRRPEGPRNSPAGSVYVVKPKMHGPDEVRFADEVFAFVEETLGLARDTVKMGVMDEERRTSANLKECIRAARNRIAFINTGFLDRTGDEIHTSMESGPMVPKGEMKGSTWIKAYEERNVDIGLALGFCGRAQIGKGMWAAPDLMHDMLRDKIAHPRAGANTAWVPSPTAATLHATHYHLVDVHARQAEIAAGGPRGTLQALLTIPLADGVNWSSDQVRAEVENNAQGILGYVVRWIDQGVGCSKVPDIHDVGLMEDRATCRISSQALANWLHHGVVTEDELIAAMRRMAAVVDRQNAGDPMYQPMAPDFDGPAFRAACDLVLQGRRQPSGYTEPLLHSWRQIRKAQG